MRLMKRILSFKISPEPLLALRTAVVFHLAFIARLSLLRFLYISLPLLHRSRLYVKKRNIIRLFPFRYNKLYKTPCNPRENCSAYCSLIGREPRAAFSCLYNRKEKKRLRFALSVEMKKDHHEFLAASLRDLSVVCSVA